jgi:4a-hydroxytetrahydrobiopterin dehydratase
MSDLASKTCVPCKGGTPSLRGDALKALYAELDRGWDLVGEHHLERGFRFPDFVTALAFVDRVGAMSEEQNHHPDIFLAWGQARIKIWTHKVDGLTESDFVYAAKCDRIYAERGV